MKVLGIAGSPRQEGNTFLLIDQVMKAAEEEGAETELVRICDLQIHPCRACGGCDKTGKCVIDDDMQGIYPKLAEFDHIVVASPIFFGSLTANLKAMIDRCQCLWIRKYIQNEKISAKLNRKGTFISVCGGKSNKFFSAAALVVKAMFITVDVEYKDELFFPGIDKRGDIKLHQNILCEASSLGKNIVRDRTIAKCGKINGGGA